MSMISDTSTPPTTLDHEATRKRKRHETESIEIDRRPFAIRPDSSDPFAAPRTFTPICLLSRAQLPLAYLDTSQQGSRLFSAHIDTLEACHEYGTGSSILIVEESREKRLYAIERAQRRTYALCRLGQWVSRRELEVVADVVLKIDERPSKKQAPQPVKSGQPWWSTAAVSLPALEHGNSVPRLAMTADAHVHTNDIHANAEDVESAESAVAKTIAAPEPTILHAVTAAPMTAQETLSDLAKHYQEALYLSRTSLAYFTKGPLSRARAAVNGITEPGSLQGSELIVFLREAIMTGSTSEKKYRDGIASIVTELPAHGLDTPEHPAKAKRQRKWKSKRDKAGFYVDEKEYVEKWWRTDDEVNGITSSIETTDLGLRRRIPRIRSRETHLQIILALEVLALEASTVVPKELHLDKVGPMETQDLETQGQEPQAAADPKKLKVKKLQDLPALLDTLLERLCIWHSLESSPAKQGSLSSAKGMEENTDDLESFCVEVIIPFFMSRIPQHAATVNKKLGGPSAPTPVKRKAVASSRRPGEPAVRQAPERQPRKPFSRTASDALGHRPSRPAPSLLRSATDTDALLAHIKRENSETPQPLDSIPKLPQPRKRTSLMQSMSFNRREVDLSSISQVNDAKLRKKVNIDEKLRDAISTLKKPDRTMAVKEIAANADLSFAKATARSRPSGAGQRAKSSTAVAQSAVHVSATPGKHGRTIKATPGQAMDPRGGSAYMPPPPSTFEVPQTSHRPRHSRAPGGVEETPSRGFAKYMPAGMAHEAGTLLESPTTTKHSQIAAPRQDWRELAESPIAKRRAPAMVQQTPVKAVRSLSLSMGPAALVAASPNLLRPDVLKDVGNGRTLKPSSIYDSLGWDDDFEEELA